MKYLALAPLFLMTACGSGSNAPGGVTAGEAKALDEAAEMLEAARHEGFLHAERFYRFST